MFTRTLLTVLCVGLMGAFGSSVIADVEPPEGAALNRVHVLFQWEEDPLAVRYHLQVAEDGADPFEGPLVVDTVVTTPYHIVTEGLQWDTAYVWRVWMDAPTGAEYHFSVIAVPETVPVITLEVDDPERYQPGVTLFEKKIKRPPSHMSLAIDENGEWVWILENGGTDPTPLANGNFMMVRAHLIAEVTLDGEVLWESPAEYNIHHDMSVMPNGNVVGVFGETRQVEQNGELWDWSGDGLVEFDRDGNVVWSWNAFDYLSLDDYDQYLYDNFDPEGDRGFDWTHANGCWYDPEEDALYMSVRHHSRVLKIDHATGDIIWTMGFPMQSGESDFGDDLFSWSHAPRLLPDGNLMLYDNGNRRGHSYGEPENPYSRAIEIAFDWEEEEPAFIVWEYTTPEYSGSQGDCPRLPNGNTLVGAGSSRRIIEVGAEGDVVWQVVTDGANILHVARVASLYLEQYWGRYEVSTAPADWFQGGWIWFSIPLVPRWTGEASEVLGFDCENRLYGWDDAEKTFLLYPDDFEDLNVGPSYMVYLGAGEYYEPAYEGAQPTMPYERTLPAMGWCLTGVPSTQDIHGLDLRVRKDGVTRTPEEDRDAPDPWLNWSWLFWDPNTRSLGIMNPFGDGDDDSVHPWWGYRVWAYVDDVTIIFPQPRLSGVF